MKFVKVGNKWINLALITFAQTNHLGGLSIWFVGDSDALVLVGEEAKLFEWNFPRE